MSRKLLACLVVFLCVVVYASLCAADNFPAPAAPRASSAVKAPGPEGAPQRFYGYVPPPPIRDTWPGGYKVIFHELREMLLNHIQGYY